MIIWVALLFAQSAVPSQFDRGEALFLDPALGCSSCHALKGKGTAVGPDLKGIARLSPAGIVMAVRSSVTQYVQNVKLKSADAAFPTLPPAAGDQPVTLYDLSKTPPEAHKVERADIGAMTANSAWKHPPTTRTYTDQQMADIIAYIKYAGTGSKTPVEPDDVK
ncbi:MAG TPA: c-type cytochrome [Bryobacteraceae bacterium]